MKDQITISKNFKLLTYILIGIGVVTFALGFVFDAKRTWANYLLNNYYFLSIAIGAAFFGSIQYITNSGWSAAFKRIPEAMAAYIPFAGIFFLIMFFGMHSIFEWTHDEVLQHDELIQHKSPYLNVPFFFIRVIVFFAAWTILSKVLRKFSLKEDEVGGLHYFHKSELYSKIFIFVIAITFTLFAVDMLLSLDPHWFSTLFAAKSFIAAFLHGSTIIALIVIILNRTGNFDILNRSHLHDFTRYIFMTSIVWGYFNFAEFMLIWYGNIPEETVWFVERWQGAYKILFFANIILNWAIPFFVLMPRKTSRSKLIIFPVIILLMIGQYTELYYIIWPNVVHESKFGLLEIGAFLGYAGIFSLVVSTWLAKASLVPKNHPYLQESLHHHF
ncbi:MAG: quinol:cytochrome C oxidoreductase [Draconibacterium sp.]|nr:quinol:cytochrome C oxidoreductase [Draconibacterium sp.]